MRPSNAISRAWFFVAVLLVPLSVCAATSVEQALTVPDSASVSRGDFIRASVQVLGIRLRNDVTLQYRRSVPVSLQPYVKTAKSLGAVAQFGNDLQLSRSITRGEALQLLMHLAGYDPASASGPAFTDVPASGDLSKAVEVAIEKQWMTPASSLSFGVDTSLNGADARSLLQAVVAGMPDPANGQPSTRVRKTIPQITIRLKAPTDVRRLPNEDMLRTVWKLLNDQYYYRDKLDEKEAAYKAAEAIVGSLNDPYTEFLRPVTAKAFSNQLGGQITGIGAQVDYKDSTVVIIAPIAGSPAAKAGLKPGDQILSVNGVSVVGIGIGPAVEKIRGPKGTVANLRIRRDGSEMDVSVTRDVVNVPEIDVSYQGTIAVVKLAQFGQTTQEKLRGVMSDIASHHPTGLVLDLRNNPGGFLSAAVTTVSNFLPEGSTVAHIVSSDSDTAEQTEDPPTIDSSVNIAVLINKGSASAAEITAGALQDAKRATIVGETSFGKGTVQQVLDFTDGSELKMTIAEWLTTARRPINHIGVKPDVEVASVDGGRDDQMLKALDLLR